MPPASGTLRCASAVSRLSAAAITAGIHSPAGVEDRAPGPRGLLGVERFAESGRVFLARAVAPPRLAGVGEEHNGPHDTVGERFGVAVGVVGLRAHQPVGVGCRR